MSIKHKMSKQEAELVSEKNSEWFSAETANIRKNYILYLSLKKNYQDRFDFLHRHNYYKLIFS